MSQCDAYEENPGNAQGNAADLDFSEQGAQGDGGGEDKYDVCGTASEQKVCKHNVSKICCKNSDF